MINHFQHSQSYYTTDIHVVRLISSSDHLMVTSMNPRITLVTTLRSNWLNEATMYGSEIREGTFTHEIILDTIRMSKQIVHFGIFHLMRWR